MVGSGGDVVFGVVDSHVAELLELFEFVFAPLVGSQVALDSDLLFRVFVYHVVYPSLLVSHSLGSNWAAIVFLSGAVCDLRPS